MKQPTALLRALLAAPLVLALLHPAPLAAQSADSVFAPRRGSPALVKFGKWGVLAAGIGMGIQAAMAHADADRAYRRLERYCFGDQRRCDQGPGGSYLDPVAERHYQSALSGDRRARGWLVGGEVAVLGAAGLFVWELTRPRQRPDNIPFEPSVTFRGPVTDLGVRLAF
jgi:hypothetical protein